jgi:ubiquinone/menaquinone biosynthesis C-methylase UbiE
MIRSVRRAFLRFAFHLLYYQLAFTYDAVAWLVSFGQWKTWGRTALSRVRGQRVLELGHGPGHLLIALARSGRAPIGIDLSPNMIRIARRRIQREQVDVPQVRCRVQALPFRSGTFDSVVATFPTEYIVEPATVQEVQRVANDQGRLVIVAGAQLTDREPGARFVDWLYRITGQNELVPGGHESIFQQMGMPPRVEYETIGASTVALVIAEKTQ